MGLKLTKKVAVLLSTFNGEKYIDEQLRSIFNQIGVSVDLYVRDDGSGDKTLKILEGWQSKKDNIFILKGVNKGPCHSFFSLVQAMSERKQYDFYSFADQDDFWYENKLLVSIEHLDPNTPQLFCSSYDVTDDKLGFIKAKTLNLCYKPENLFVEGVFPGCTMVFTCAFFKELNRSLKNKYTWKTSIHDAWLVRLACLKGEIITNQTPLLAYRQHSANAIGTSTNLRSKINKVVKNVVKSKEKWSLIDETILFRNVFSEEIGSNTNLDNVLKNILLLDQSFLIRLRIVLEGFLYREGLVKNIIFKIMIILKIYRRHIRK